MYIGGESITLALMITGGSQGHIHTPFLIFTNSQRSYPIRGLRDNVHGVAYRSQAKGWMDRKIFQEWLGDERILSG